MAKMVPKVEDLRKMVPALEKLSLLYADDKTIRRYTDTVMAAQLMRSVDTTGVEPMYSLLENKAMKTREDVVEMCDKNDVLKPSSKTVEGYFVTPPGNLPFDSNDGHKK